MHMEVCVSRAMTADSLAFQEEVSELSIYLSLPPKNSCWFVSTHLITLHDFYILTYFEVPLNLL